MSKVLKNPIAAPKTATKSAWDYTAPSYDNRSSCGVSAGDSHGVGVRQPVGGFSASSIEDGPIPMRSQSFKPGKILGVKDE